MTKFFLFLNIRLAALLLILLSYILSRFIFSAFVFSYKNCYPSLICFLSSLQLIFCKQFVFHKTLKCFKRFSLFNLLATIYSSAINFLPQFIQLFILVSLILPLFLPSIIVHNHYLSSYQWFSILKALQVLHTTYRLPTIASKKNLNIYNTMTIEILLVHSSSELVFIL